VFYALPVDQKLSYNTKRGNSRQSYMKYAKKHNF
jgi:hypothetical protein